MNRINHRLLRKYNDLEKLRAELFGIIDSVNEETLTYKPAYNKWSILQIIFHLVKTEQLSLISIQNNLKKNSGAGYAGLGAKVRAGLLILAMKSSLKFKAPQIAAKVPENYSIDELKTKWVKIRGELNIVLNNINPDDCRKNLFKHPYSGNMNIYQALGFLHSHFTHHYRQIEKILNLAKQK